MHSCVHTDKFGIPNWHTVAMHAHINLSNKNNSSHPFNRKVGVSPQKVCLANNKKSMYNL